MQSCVVYPMLYALLKLISFVAYFIRLTLCNCCNGLGCKAQPPDSTATLLTGVSSALRNRMNLEVLKFPPVSAELRDRMDPSRTLQLRYLRSYWPSPPGVPFRPEKSGILPDFFFKIQLINFWQAWSQEPQERCLYQKHKGYELSTFCFFVMKFVMPNLIAIINFASMPKKGCVLNNPQLFALSRFQNKVANSILRVALPRTLAFFLRVNENTRTDDSGRCTFCGNCHQNSDFFRQPVNHCCQSWKLNP